MAMNQNKLSAPNYEIALWLHHGEIFTQNTTIIILDHHEVFYIKNLIKVLHPEHKIITLEAYDSPIESPIPPTSSSIYHKLRALESLINISYPTIILIEKEVLNEKVPHPQCFIKNKFTIKMHENLLEKDLIDFLENNGYSRTSTVYEPFEYAIRGSIIDVFPSHLKKAIRIEREGNAVISIRELDIIEQKRMSALDYIDLYPSFMQMIKENGANFQEYFKIFPHSVCCYESYLPLLQDTPDNSIIFERSSGDCSLINWPKSGYFTHRISFLLEALKGYLGPHGRPLASLGMTERGGSMPEVKIICDSHDSLEHLKQLISPYANDLGKPQYIIAQGLTESFVSKNLAVILGKELLSINYQSTKSKHSYKNIIQSMNQIQSGDLVVHIDHGIGLYRGLTNIKLGKYSHECCVIEYDGGSKLFLPIENLDALSRYGGNVEEVVLDKLGSANWKNRKKKVKQNLEDVALELIERAAVRENLQIDSLNPPDDLYEKFIEKFPYQLTVDQDKAINSVLQDLVKSIPMDRLICGDVGFGKTEVAMRAAWVVASSGKQVALIVPTTVLCKQHYNSFRNRFEEFGIKVAELSRMVNKRKIPEIRSNIESGKVDIVIGTHALLKQKFHNLGLIIVDEEQRFGVMQKEKIKAWDLSAHLLTLSATPIPRTLQFALSGLKDLSLIITPPLQRMPIKTYVMKWEGEVVKEAILREYNRGGKSFVVCPYVKDIVGIQKDLHYHLPHLKIAVAHGKMDPHEIEEVMINFGEKDIDVLLSTNLIESGIDVPMANTIIVYNAHLFGLAQLYQLRGRVGRREIQGYAYLFYREKSYNNLDKKDSEALTKSAYRRLKAIESIHNLGEGFKIASYDMDIRGFGNILGTEQSGHIKEVGVGLYQTMLSEAISNHRKQKVEVEEDVLSIPRYTPKINMQKNFGIPESYIADADIRMEYYQKINGIRNKREATGVLDELTDNFGPPPKEVHELLEVIEIKNLCYKINIDELWQDDKGITVSFYENYISRPERLLAFVQKNPKLLSLSNKENRTKLHYKTTGPDVKRFIEKLYVAIR